MSQTTVQLPEHFGDSIAHIARLVRTLPVATAQRFLANLLPVLPDCEDVHPLRAAFIALNQTDSQLELISGRAS